MKLIDTTCPHCGSALKIDPSNKNATCEYCGAALLIDNEVQHIQYDNAEEAGYKFEKGRQRAQAEARQKVKSDNTQVYVDKPKKRKTWLWVLGWICIFPLPLTILLLRKKDMNKIIKYGIIAVAWIVYLLIGFSGNSGNKTTEQQANSSIEKATDQQADLSIEKTTEAEEAKSQVEIINTDNTSTATQETNLSDTDQVIVQDEVVNRFITEFNAKYDDEIVDVTKGNIRTKYYGYVQDTRLEMINANDAAAKAFSISIYGGKEEADCDAMFAVFKEVAKILEPGLTDEIIDTSVEELINGAVLCEGYRLGNTLDITYVPTKELSSGKNDCRVDILAKDYNETPSENLTSSEPVELNSLQTLFVSLTTEMTRDEIDEYISENGMVKYAFSHDSAYYIGYESSAIRQRGRDRVGEAVDINFVTSGDPNKIGMVKSAEYAVHTEASTHYALKFEEGVFYFDGQECSSADEAMQKFLATN